MRSETITNARAFLFAAFDIPQVAALTSMMHGIFDALAPSSDDCAKPKPETDASKRYEEEMLRTDGATNFVHIGGVYVKQTLVKCEREAAAAVIEELKRERDDWMRQGGSNGKLVDHYISKLQREEERGDGWRKQAEDRAAKLDAAEKRVVSAEEQAKIGWQKFDLVMNKTQEISLGYEELKSRADLAERRLAIARECLDCLNRGGGLGLYRHKYIEETLKRIDGVGEEPMREPAVSVAKDCPEPSAGRNSSPALSEIQAARKATDKCVKWGNAPPQIAAERAATDREIAKWKSESERMYKEYETLNERQRETRKEANLWWRWAGALLKFAEVEFWDADAAKRSKAVTQHARDAGIEPCEEPK